MWLIIISLFKPDENTRVEPVSALVCVPVCVCIYSYLLTCAHDFQSSHCIFFPVKRSLKKTLFGSVTWLCHCYLHVFIYTQHKS